MDVLVQGWDRRDENSQEHEKTDEYEYNFSTSATRGSRARERQECGDLMSAVMMMMMHIIHASSDSMFTIMKSSQ